MSCDRVQALLGVPAELDRAERLLLTRHLRDCADCRTAMLDEERVRSHLAGLPELPVPARLQAQLMAIPAMAPQQAAPVLGRWLLGLGLAIGLLGLTNRLQGPAGLRPLPAPAGSAVPKASERPLDAAAMTGVDPTAAVAGLPPTAESSPGGASGDRKAMPTTRPTRTTRPGGARARPADLDSANGPAAPQSDLGAPAPAQQAPKEPRDKPREAPSAEPPRLSSPSPEASSTPLTCIQLSFEAFLDLAGDSGRDCPGCDGHFTEADAVAATAAGLVLPGAAVFWVDASGMAGNDAIPMTNDGAIARLGTQTLCGAMPITVGLSIGLPENLGFCPVTPERRILELGDDPGGTIRWAIGQPQCPTATATPPGAAQETPAAPDPTSAPPAASPEPQPGEQPPSGTATAQGSSASSYPPSTVASSGARAGPRPVLQAWYPLRT